MTSFFDRFKGRREPTSAQIAKERLKLVLVTDRSDLTPERLRALQGEILEVIKRYIHIDEMEVEIKIEQRDRKNYLVADIPLHRDHAYAQQPPNAMDAQSAATQAEQLSAELDSAAPGLADEDGTVDADEDSTPTAAPSRDEAAPGALDDDTPADEVEPKAP